MNDCVLKQYQTGLQIATIAKIDEFMTWKAEIEALPCPSVHQKIENSTISKCNHTGTDDKPSYL